MAGEQGGNRHQFELTVVGCSGGPIEKGTCAYLLKPSSVSYSKIVEDQLQSKFICIDGGSGISGLAEMIAKTQNDTLMVQSWLLDLYGDSLPIGDYTACATTIPFDMAHLKMSSPLQLAAKIYDHLSTYLVTHLHMDHLTALVLNSPTYKSKTIAGGKDILSNLRQNIFNNRIWPNLPSVNFKLLESDSRWTSISEDFEVRLFSHYHGSFIENSHRIRYTCNAFLIRDTTDSNLLLFGDIEPDSVSGTDVNLQIWRQVAPLVQLKKLLGIVIECSNFIQPSDTPLYGHMNPTHLILEFEALNSLLKHSSLKGLNVIVTHVKETLDGSDPRKRILKELNVLNHQRGLGLVFTMALPGLTYCL